MCKYMTKERWEGLIGCSISYVLIALILRGVVYDAFLDAALGLPSMGWLAFWGAFSILFSMALMVVVAVRQVLRGK